MCVSVCVRVRARVCHTHKTHTLTHLHTNNEVDMRGHMNEGVDGALLPHHTRISIYPEVERGRGRHREGGWDPWGG